MKSKESKIKLLSDLIAGKVSAKDVIKSMPRPLCIEWSETDHEENIYVCDGRLVNKPEFDRVVKWRAKHG